MTCPVGIASGHRRRPCALHLPTILCFQNPKQSRMQRKSCSDYRSRRRNRHHKEISVMERWHVGHVEKFGPTSEDPRHSLTVMDDYSNPRYDWQLVTIVSCFVFIQCVEESFYILPFPLFWCHHNRPGDITRSGVKKSGRTSFFKNDARIMWTSRRHSQIQPVICCTW